MAHFRESLLVAGALLAAGLPAQLAVADEWGPKILLEQTATLDGRHYTCGNLESVAVPQDAVVFFCYRVTNIGEVTLTRHSLEDEQFGPILTDIVSDLQPGDSLYLALWSFLSVADGNTATWTSYNPGPTDLVTSSDELVLIDVPPAIGCNGATTTFTSGLAAGWTSFDRDAWLSGGGFESPIDFWTLDGCLEAENYTGAGGDAACASSALGPVGGYTAALWSPPFSLENRTSARVEFDVNYQDFGTADALDLDYSVGTNWNNLWHQTSDLGGFRTVGGVRVTVPLDSLLDLPRVRLRWHYWNQSAGAHDGYAQVDNVTLLCDSGVFFDSFESGNLDAWTAAVDAP